jgi:hypothetical protein
MADDQNDEYSYDDDDDENSGDSDEPATIGSLARTLSSAHASPAAPAADDERRDVDPNLKYRGSNVEVRDGSLRVTVPGTGEPFVERRVVLRHTPAMVIDANGASERVYPLKRAMAGFEDMGAARFRVWATGLNRWSFTFEAANTSTMMDWLNAFETVGVDLLTDWAPDAAADAATAAARSTLQVEGHADTFDPTRTINSVPRHNSKGNAAPLPPPKASGAASGTPAKVNSTTAVSSVVSQKRDGLSQVTTTTTVTQETQRTPSGRTVVTTTTRTAEQRKAGLLASLAASNTNYNLPQLTPADRETARLAVDAPRGSKADWLCKLSSSNIRGNVLQKRWCSIDVQTHMLIYGEFGTVDAKSAGTKSGETVSSTYVATQKAQQKLKSGIAMLKGKLNKKADDGAVAASTAAAATTPAAAPAGAPAAKVVFYQKGAIPLQECLLQSIDDERLRAYGAFGVGHRERTFVFVPFHPDERNAWIDALRRAGATDGTSVRMPAAAMSGGGGGGGGGGAVAAGGAAPAASSSSAVPIGAPTSPAREEGSGFSRLLRTNSTKKPLAASPGGSLASNGPALMNADDDAELTASEVRSLRVDQERLAQAYGDPSTVFGGVLTKVSGLSNSFHARWFAVQRSGDLVWGVFQRDKVQTTMIEFIQRGAVPLRGGEAFRLTRAEAHRHRSFGFGVCAAGSDRPLQLFAESDGEIGEWQRALREAGCDWYPANYERLQRFLGRVQSASTGSEAAAASAADVARRRKRWAQEDVYIDPVAPNAARRERFAQRIGENVKYMVADSIRDDALMID